MSVPSLQAQVNTLQAQVNNLQAEIAQDEQNFSPLAQAAAPTLPDILPADLDGKVLRVSIAGISGLSGVRIYLNGNTIFSFGTPGFTFVRGFLLTWNSTKQEVWSDGNSSILQAFSPAAFTFSTDSANTVTSFSVRAM